MVYLSLFLLLFNKTKHDKSVCLENHAYKILESNNILYVMWMWFGFTLTTIINIKADFKLIQVRKVSIVV